MLTALAIGTAVALSVAAGVFSTSSGSMRILMVLLGYPSVFIYMELGYTDMQAVGYTCSLMLLGGLATFLLAWAIMSRHPDPDIIEQIRHLPIEPPYDDTVHGTKRCSGMALDRRTITTLRILPRHPHDLH